MLHMDNELIAETRLNYLSIGYDLIAEPLNLKQSGQQWFNEVFRQHAPCACGNALLLGAVVWMADRLLAGHEKCFVVDACHQALDRFQTAGQFNLNTHDPYDKHGGDGKRQNRHKHHKTHRGNSELRLVHANWTRLPDNIDNLTLITGDNAFIYLRFPDQWRGVLKDFHSRMAEGGVLLLRTFSVPDSHEIQTMEQIAESLRAAEAVNFTALRTKILFNFWNSETYAIDTEQVHAVYENKRHLFRRILNHCGVIREPNDLDTIIKYRDCGIVYYAPPLGKILEMVGNCFDISCVSFGPYAMSRYFPLIVARKT